MAFSIRDGGPSPARHRFQELVAELRRRSQERLASGRRITRAADDSAGLAIARRLEAAVRGSVQGEANLANGQGLVRTAEASLQSSHDALSRMRELTIQAQNGALTEGDRDIIQQEYDQLAAQLDQTAGGTNYAGRPLLDGSASGDGAITLTDGNGGDTTVEIGDVSAAGLGVAGLAVGDPNTLAALDAAGAALAGQRASLGAIDNSLGYQQRQLAATRINTEEARSRIEDADIAREVAESSRSLILSQLQLAGQLLEGRQSRGLIDLLG